MTQPGTPKKKTSTGMIVLGVILLLAIIGAIAGNQKSSSNSALPTSSPSVDYVAPAYSPPPQVIYSISGTFAGASVTMQAPTGTVQSEYHGAGTVGTYSFDSGDFVYLSAQNQGDSGSITCTITEGDTVISTNTSTGAYVIASCNGRA